MLQAGFDQVVTTASCELFATPERLRFAANLFVSRCDEADLRQRVLGQGLVSAERLAATLEAWRAWPESPGAFGALAEVEVVGWQELGSDPQAA